jgi:uncharacterized protein
MSAVGTATPLQQYRAALARGQFRIQQCRDCGKYVFEPQAACPHCASAELRWTEPSGRGVVCSTSVLVQGLHNDDPHPLVQVELEEGPRMAGRVLDVEVGQLQPGLPVSAHIALVAGEPTVVFYNKEQGSREW